MSVTINYE